MLPLARLTVIGLLLSRTALQAATFTVNSTVDAVDANPGDGVCATAGPTPVCTLRAAVQEANKLAGADTVIIPAGTYTLTIAGRNENAAATGDLDINDPSAGALTITGAGASTTIVDGGGLDRVFDIYTAASISGVTIRNGNPGAGAYGGGLYNSDVTTLADAVVTGNTADVSGGGIRNDNDLTLRNVTLKSNTANTSGGGLDNTSTATLTGVTVSGNTANTGGGIGNDFILTLTNVTVSGNTAHTNGGGVTNNVTATLTNVTISGNTAEAGGASGGNYYYVGDAMFMNVIVANSASADNCTGFGTLTSGGHNLDTANTCGFAATGDLINTNPLLGPLQDNGGPTFTEALLPGSPAIDAGANCPPTDQRGVMRPIDGNGDGVAVCDIGAFEFQPSASTTTSTTTTTLPSCSPGATFPSIDCRLEELITTVADSVPAGPVHDGLEKSAMKAKGLIDQAEQVEGTGHKRKAKGLLGKATGSLGKFQARLRTRKAKHTVPVDVLNGLQRTTGQIQADLRTLRSSL